MGILGVLVCASGVMLRADVSDARWGSEGGMDSELAVTSSSVALQGVCENSFIRNGAASSSGL